MVTKTAYFTEAKDLLQQFDSIEKVKQYEAYELARLRCCNKDIAERRKQHKETVKNIYKQYG